MMKPLLYGTAIAAALMATVPGWAQQSTMTPSGTPTTSQPAPYAQTAPMAPSQNYQPNAQQPSASSMPQANSYGTPRAGASQRMPQTGAYTQQPAAAMPPTGASGTTGDQTMDAMPAPRRHHASRRHHVRHGRMTASASRRGRGTSDNVADQLNRDEAGRLSSGSSMAPGGSMPMGQPQNGPAYGTQMR